MQPIITILLALALFGLPALPATAIAHAAPARTHAQLIEPLTANLQIIDPGSSRSVVFSVVYTMTVTWPDSTVVTTTTTVPTWMTDVQAPDCTHILDQIGCTVEAQAGEPVAIVLKFAVPADVRGQVAITSTAIGDSGGSATAGASFYVPPQSRLPLIRY